LTVGAASANSAATATNDSVTTNEDMPAEIDVLANDTDADNDDVAIVAWTLPAHGTLALDTRGTPLDPSDDLFLYRPERDFFGSDSFTYTIDDGRGGYDTATVSITVASVNDVPTLAHDLAAAADGEGLIFVGGGVRCRPVAVVGVEA